ncbi:MAG TPA: M50 family metallopeptidase [Roseiflexaceae bacterium]|nr:M50 family metallopeptidase [Roseiflexaceae bacterium]HMP39024.1 M50 family metallopeptidase [Roseiflexaceae bacterium]
MLDALAGNLLTIVAFLGMLGLLVLVHELGHFLTAIRLGIKVDEFGFGYPPRMLVLFERKGVKYTLNWLPLGGFVRFSGDGEQVYGVGGLAAAAPWKKIVVLVAGPLMNLLLAIVIFIGLFLVRGVPTVLDGALISSVFPGTPAAAAEFRNGDVLVNLNGVPIRRDLDQIRTIAGENAGIPIPAVVERDGRQLTLTVVPGPWSYQDSSSAVGFGFSYGTNASLQPASLPAAISAGFFYTFDLLGRFIAGIGQMIGGLFGANEPPPGGVAGVVGIARGTGEIIQRDGLFGFWQWTALISLNLFLVNLLPIPALDGSHILFALLEVVRRGRKIPPEKEAMVHAVGFVMLMGLMVIITISDVAQWLSGAPVLGG